MASLSDIRSGFATVIGAATGLRVWDVMPAKPEPPCLAVLPKSWAYQETFDGNVLWEFELWVYVNPADLGRAQRAYDAYMAPDGAQSVAAAVSGDPSLGGLTDVYATVWGAAGYAQLVDTAGSQLLGGYVRATVLA